jgi:putative ATPase
LGHGVGYQYPHDHPGHFVPQDYLGVDKVFYEPGDQGAEKRIQERLRYWRSLREGGGPPASTPPRNNTE